MNGKEEQLRVYLKANCSGRENIQKSGQLERARVVADFACSFPPYGEKLARSVAPPFPTRTALLSSRGGPKSKNELCRLVHRLRRRGIPIASSRDGYFFSVTAGEVYSTIRQLRRMAGGLEAAIGGLEGALEKFGPAASAGGDSP